MKNIIVLIVGAIVCGYNIQANSITYEVVNTGLDKCYNNTREISYPKSHQSFYGQDAEYISNIPRYKDNSDGTITDINTGLMWSKAVDERKVSLSEAKNIAKEMTLGEYKDWRLPNAKELQSIVDYTRSPDTTSSPAINQIFKTSSITNEAGVKDYPFFWTSTTHLDGPWPGSNAAYFSFGRAIGQMHGTVMDVHGAGAQRSDPKIGSSQIGHGPQGDAVRIHNFVRCVRAGNVKLRLSAPIYVKSKYPYNINLSDYIKFPKKHRNVNESDFTFNYSDRQHPNPGSQRKTGFVNRLDKNNDGKVSIDEFDGPKHHFYDLDRNNDGYLSEIEAPHRTLHN